jgi:hypothetical protein
MSEMFKRDVVEEDIKKMPDDANSTTWVADQKRAEIIVKYIEQHMEHTPNRNAGNVPELFKDYGDGEIDEEIANLWRCGIICVERNETGEQMVNLSEFGEELHEKGVADDYIHAKLGNVREQTFTTENAGVRVL